MDMVDYKQARRQKDSDDSGMGGLLIGGKLKESWRQPSVGKLLDTSKASTYF